MLHETAYYTRMTRGVYRYLRTPPVSDVEGMIRGQLENRESAWLDTVRRVVFANPANPFHRLFHLAGCTYQDLAETVRRDGLEATLAALHRQGVYLTHQEFKGRAPIVRSGQHIPSDGRSFSNPLVKGLMETVSSGSRSPGTRTRQGIPYRVYCEAYALLTQRELDLAGRPYCLLWPILPSEAGFLSGFTRSRLKHRVERWFTIGGTLQESGHYWMMTEFLVLFSRLMGVRIPFPSRLPPNDFSPVAEWLARRSLQGVRSVVATYVSPAARVAAAALERGLDLRGTLFQVTGETLTGAKRALIERAGAEVFPFYWISELGPIGYSCRQMRTGNCVHLFRDALAVIGHPRQAPLSDVQVNSLLFTTLLPFAPHVLINVEMDDSGVIEPAGCDCLFTRAGLTEQIRDISSFGKLTGQGMTLVGTDLVRILEETLPARFGGHPGDYQLVEQEGPAQTQLRLHVSPRVLRSSPQAVRDCFLQEIRRFHGGALAARVWRHTEALEVVQAEPLTTSTGKVLPLHLLGAGAEHRQDP